jgi:hypothetical protein
MKLKYKLFILKNSFAMKILVLLFSATCLFLGSPVALAQENGADNASPSVYPVNGIEFIYASPHPDHIPEKELEKTELELAIREGKYGTQKELDFAATPVSIESISNAGATYLTAGAIQRIIETVLAGFNDRGFMGVFVLPHPQDISLAGQDLREGSDKTLHFLIFTSSVEEISTLAPQDRRAERRRDRRPAAQEPDRRLYPAAQPPSGKKGFAFRWQNRTAGRGKSRIQRDRKQALGCLCPVY